MTSQIERRRGENPGATLPQWASVLPAEPAFAIAVEDADTFRDACFPTDPSKEGSLSLEGIVALILEFDPEVKVLLEAEAAIVRKLLGALKGSFCVGVTETPQWPTLFFVGSLKPEVKDFCDFVSREVQPLFAPLGMELVLQKGESVHRLQLDESVLYFATVGPRLLASTDRTALLHMKKGDLPAESTLAGSESFRKAVTALPPKGFFLFADIKSFTRLNFGRLSAGTSRALSDLGLGRFESLAFSANIDGSFLTLDFALTNAGEFTGLPAVFMRPNTVTRAAKLVPPDYSLFLRASVAGADDAYREWQALVRRIVDDVSWKEYQNALAELTKQRGFALEDAFENLGDEIALAVKIPELAGVPPTLVFVALKNEAKALDALSDFLTRSGAKPQVVKVVNGATIYTTSLIPQVALSYALKGGYLIVGLAPSSVELALAASESGNSLARAPDFAAALEAAPEQNLFFAYADVDRLLDFGASSLLWLDRPAHGTSLLDPQTGEYSTIRHVASIMRKLVLESNGMGRAVAHATPGKDYIALRLELSTQLIRGLASLSSPAIARSRESARRAACLNNMKQINLGCHTYAPDHKDKFPNKLSELYPDYINSLGVFCCPSTETVISRPEDIDARSSYKLIGGLALRDVKGSDLVLYESLENHGDGANGGFADGHVKWLSPQGFRSELKKAGL